MLFCGCIAAVAFSWSGFWDVALRLPWSVSTEMACWGCFSLLLHANEGSSGGGKCAKSLWKFHVNFHCNLSLGSTCNNHKSKNQERAAQRAKRSQSSDADSRHTRRHRVDAMMMLLLVVETAEVSVHRWALAVSVRACSRVIKAMMSRCIDSPPSHTQTSVTGTLRTSRGCGA